MKELTTLADFLSSLDTGSVRTICFGDMAILHLVFAIFGYDIIFMNTVMTCTDDCTGGNRVERFPTG